MNLVLRNASLELFYLVKVMGTSKIIDVLPISLVNIKAAEKKNLSTGVQR